MLFISSYRNYYARCRRTATNVVAEIQAVKFAIEQAGRLNKLKLSIFTDCDVVVDAVTKYIKQWKETGWCSLLDGHPILYRSDFEDLERTIKDHSNINLKFNLVKAHSDNQNHNEADHLARKGAELP